MKTTVLFDFDGTLIDTHQLIVRGLDAFSLMHRGHALSTEDHLRIVGAPLDIQLIAATGFCNDTLVHEFKTWYEHRHDLMVSAFPGVTDLISFLKSKSYKLGIVTNNSRSGLNKGLRLLGLSDAFDVIVTYEDVQERKPSPEGLQIAMHRLGVHPQECYFVGDSNNDLLAGTNASIQTILVGWTYQDRQQLMTYNPHLIIEHPLDLAEHLILLDALTA